MGRSAFRRMWYIVIVVLALVAGGLVYYVHRGSRSVATQKEPSEIPMVGPPNRIDRGGAAILTEEQAQIVALERTGLGKLGKMRKPVLIKAESLHIPFIGRNFECKPAWEITFDDVHLKIPSQTEQSKDQYTRIFRVLLEAHTGQVLLISSRFSGTSENTYEQPPDWFATNQM